MFDPDFYIIILGMCLVFGWIIAEFWDYMVTWWNTEIVADYPYEDDL